MNQFLLDTNSKIQCNEQHFIPKVPSNPNLVQGDLVMSNVVQRITIHSFNDVMSLVFNQFWYYEFH